MILHRKSNDRGHADHGWLNTRHTFSFADYHDPEFMGFKSLRVINEDRIAGGTGFGKHPHRDMEIITYVVKGELQHFDTMGNEATILPGEVQKLSAGFGMQHSEINGSKTGETHLLQIWIIPNKTGQAPSYGQKSFEKALAAQPLVLALSADGRDESIPILQDADVYVSRLKPNGEFSLKCRPGRALWVQLISGKLKVNQFKLEAGDGLAIDQPGDFKFVADAASELILFDLV